MLWTMSDEGNSVRIPKKTEVEELKSLVLECMELGQPFKVPLEVDINCGESWKE